MSTPRTRRSGTGSIVNIGPNTWRVRISWGVTGGRRVREKKIIVGTKAKAEAYLQERSNARGSLASTKLTLGEWLDAHYFPTFAKAKLSAGTQETYERMIRLYLPARLRACRLDKLTTEAIQSLYNDLMVGKGTTRGEPLAPGTVHYLHRVLRGALNRAVKAKRIATNPAKDVDQPAKDHREMLAFSPEQGQMFLAEAEGTPWYALWVVLLTCGLRPGEALGLKWEDLAGDTLRVRRSLSYTSAKKWSFVIPKTKAARVVRLPVLAIKALTSHRRQQAATRLKAGEHWQDHGLVFPTAAGLPVDGRMVARIYLSPLLYRTACRVLGRPWAPFDQAGHRRKEVHEAWERYQQARTATLEEAHLAGFRLYDLRHSAATIALALGEHPKVVSERLGHSSIHLTLDTYTHVLPDMQQRAAERLDTFYGPGPGLAVVR